MVYGRSTRWLFLLLLVLMVIAVRSLVARYDLRSEAPSDFADGVPKEYPNGRLLSERYWENARVVASRYGYGQVLPESQPPEFALRGAHLTPTQQAQLEHTLWKQLQVAWRDPSNWKKHYAFDLGWISRAVLSIGDKIEEHLPALKK